MSKIERNGSFRRADMAVDLADVASQAGGLHLLNTTVIPSGADGKWVVAEITADQARGLLSSAQNYQDCGAGGGWSSHIGHSATAEVANAVLRWSGIEQDRTPWDGSGCGLAIQLRGRIPEGSILDREAMEQLGYDLRVIYKVADDGMPAEWHRPGSGTAAEEARDILTRSLKPGPYEGQGYRLILVHRSGSRRGGLGYYSVFMSDPYGSLPAEPSPGSLAGNDLTEMVWAVLADPLRDLPSGPGGYCGGGTQPATISLSLLRCTEEESAQHFRQQLAAALGIAQVLEVTIL